MNKKMLIIVTAVFFYSLSSVPDKGYATDTTTVPTSIQSQEQLTKENTIILQNVIPQNKGIPQIINITAHKKTSQKQGHQEAQKPKK